MRTFKVAGMHCHACTKVIQMEIEDLSLEDNIVSISVDEKSQIGSIELQNVTEQEVEVIKNAIEAIGGYKVLP